MEHRSSVVGKAELAKMAHICVFGLIALVYLMLAFHPIWDVDVFWHIAAGEWIVRNLALPQTDIFSAVDPERSWYTFQWLYEVMTYGADQAAGLTAVRLLHALVVTASLVFLAVFSYGRMGFGGAIAVLGVLVVLFADRLRVRPDVFNLLFLIALLPDLVAPKLTRWSLIRVGLLSGLWANVHAGGALLAPILTAARFGGLFLGHSLPASGTRRLCLGDGWGRVRLDAAFALVALAAACVMPGFVRGTWQAFTMLGPSERFIPEWMTTFEFLFEHARTTHEFVAGVLPFLGLAVLAGLARPHLLKRGEPSYAAAWRDFALAVPVVFLGLLHVRLLWLGFLPWWLVLERLRPLVRPRRFCAAAIVAGVLLIGLDVHYHVWRLDRGPAAVAGKLSLDLEPGEYPEQAADFLTELGVSGRVLNHAAWGGYLLYRLWPDCTVFTDGRGNFRKLETELLTMMERPRLRRVAANRALDEVGVDLVVHPDPFPLLDADPARWVLAYRDRVARVYFSRTAAANLEVLADAMAGRGIDVNGGLEEYNPELQRAIVRHWGEVELALPRNREKLQLLSHGVAQPGGAVRLAAFYFDLGLYERARTAVLRARAGAEGLDPNVEVLLLLAYMADDYPAQVREGCDELMPRLQSDRSLQDRMNPRALAMFSHACSVAAARD